jgi:hypothetical protein
MLASSNGSVQKLVRLNKDYLEEDQKQELKNGHIHLAIVDTHHLLSDQGLLLENIDSVITAIRAINKHHELYTEYMPFDSFLKVMQGLVSSLNTQ